MAIASNFPTVDPSLLLDFANTKRLDSRVTFTRTTTATYYDGVTTAMAEQNLLLQSQNFTTSWVNVNTTDTADTQTAPDGTSTADTITASAGVSIDALVYQLSIPATSGLVYSLSVFAKAGTHNYLQLTTVTINTTNTFADFDLNAGTAGTTGNCTSTITSVGNSWYRCTMTFTAESSTTAGVIYIGLAVSASATRFQKWSPTGTESIYLWGAQLEQRSSVSSYTATTTQPITNYIPVLLTAASGVARFDHNPTTDESLGLLIEEQRSNLYTDSFINKTSGLGMTYSNGFPALDPTQYFVLGQETTANSEHYFEDRNFTPTLSTTYAFSVYAKQGPGTRLLRLRLGAGNVGSADFNLQTGFTGGLTGVISSQTITSVGNGVYRCVAIWTATAASNTVVRFQLLDNANTVYTGNGYSGIFIWGAQLEAGAFPTSYIATTAATVTRNADAASMTGTNFTSWYNQGEGTLYAEFSAPNTEVNTRIAVGVNDGTTSEWILIGKGANNRSTSEVYDGGAIQVTLPSAAGNLVSTSGKVSFAYKVNDFAASTNSLLDGTDTSGTLPTVSQMNIGDRATGSRQLNGTIKKIAYYPTRLTNANLQALTS